MEYIYIGKLVNTHGIKGEVRILSDYRFKDKIFIKGFKFYVGKEKKEFEIETYRHHKNFEMVVFKGFYDINLVEHLKGSYVYIDKNDLILEKSKIYAFDLIGFNVIIDNKIMGVISNIIDTVANEVLVLDNNIMIPYVDEFILSINESKKEVIVKNVKGLIS